MTSIKKQALSDAKELYDLNAKYWTLYDKTCEKAVANSKYEDLFRSAFNDHTKISFNAENVIEPAVQVVSQSKGVTLTWNPLRINKTFVVGVLIGVAIHELELDKYAVAKAKQAYKRFSR